MLASGMPAGFSSLDVAYVAALAKLELDPSEERLFERQLGEILAYAQSVQQIDTTGIPPTAYVVGDHSQERPDEIQPSLDRAETLANAPESSRAAGLFKVPRVIG
jgi:aspartyl-tRNA(Asn)/glutamyl-tRNA(Gln) amidotransferase subunit C